MILIPLDPGEMLHAHVHGGMRMTPAAASGRIERCVCGEASSGTAMSDRSALPLLRRVAAQALRRKTAADWLVSEYYGLRSRA